MPERGLDAYRRKRDFDASPEPDGSGEGREGPARRFVIQEHSATRLHWDLRLEHDGALASWALPNGLPWAPGDNRLAVRTEDHPLEYLEFSGEIPPGQYGAGTMSIWDHGTYEPLLWQERKVEVTLRGERAQGRYALFPLGSAASGGPAKEWMIHRMDPPVPDPTPPEPMPAQLVPMLARPGALPADDDRWAYELKWDGVRALCFSEPGRLRLVSRNGNDITARYPELARLNRALSMHRVILDGEVVAFEPGGDGRPPRPSFALLQRRMHLTRESQVRRQAREHPVTYIVFDLLWLDGHSLMALSYEERRRRLAALLAADPAQARWQVPDHTVGHGEALLEATRQQGLEGLVAKRLDSPYEPGRRSSGWVKVKNMGRQEFVIGGWIPMRSTRPGHASTVGALLLGTYEGDVLRCVGRAGTGFTDEELKRLAARLGPLRRRTSPFRGGPRPPRDAVFVEPRLVCEVEFMGWTEDRVLRAASYKGLRDDKPAELVVVEGLPRRAVTARVGERELRLTNLDKPLWPSGHTKADLIRYLVEMAPVLVAHLRDRPLTLKRYPDGAQADFFYEKQAPGHRPDWVPVVTVPSEREGAITFVVAQDAATLAWLGNLADLELHTSLHRVRPDGTAGPPTVVAFDLDPGEPAGLLECCEVALLLQGMFEHLGLRAHPKTSGAKGMQVYLPLNVPGVTYGQTRAFARAVAELLASEAPDLVVARQAKAQRRGRVLVDWLQNEDFRTTVCAYSPRARDRPTVSTPLSWDEVRAAAASGDVTKLICDIDTMPARVHELGDLFAETLTLTQELPG